MHTTWIVAADSSRARIFEAEGRTDHLREIEEFSNPAGRAKNSELRTDGPGRYYGRGERDQAHTAPNEVSPVDHETELFTKSLSDYLDKARMAHRYDKLRLIAPPKFLGLLRQNLSKEAQKLVEQEMAKDISWFEAREIEGYLKMKQE